MTTKLSSNEIDRMLRETITRLGAISKDPLAGRDARTIAAGVSLLALTIADQERRLRALGLSAQ